VFPSAETSSRHHGSGSSSSGIGSTPISACPSVTARITAPADGWGCIVVWLP
jgi:hypothetical protein